MVFIDIECLCFPVNRFKVKVDVDLKRLTVAQLLIILFMYVINRLKHTTRNK